MVKTLDVTEAIFSQDEPTYEERTRWGLWALASEETSRMIGGLPLFERPTVKCDYINRVYRVYLAKAGLKHEEDI